MSGSVARTSLKLTELKRRCNYTRWGLWAWNTALGNLVAAGEVLHDTKTGVYRLPAPDDLARLSIPPQKG